MAGGDDLVTLALALGAHLLQDHGALLLRLLAHTSGLVAGLGELSLVLLKHALGLGLGRIGLFDTAFDGLATLFQNLVDVREELLGEEAEDDEEGDEANDELGNRRDQRVFRFLRGKLNQRVHVSAFRLGGWSGSEDLYLP